MFYLAAIAIWFITIWLFTTFAVDSIIFPFYILFSMIGIILLLITYKTTRCPNPKCRKAFAMKEVNRTVIDVRMSKKKEQRKGYDPFTKRIEPYYIDVPATKIIYEVTERCPYCNRERTKYDDEIN